MALDLDTVALFVRVAALGNVSAAGRERGLSPATASTRLTQLEGALGARLLHRTTRRVALTQEGEAFVREAQTLLAAEAQAMASVGQGHAAPQGRLRVSCSSSFGRQHVSPALSAFLARYPGISLDFRLTDRVVDLIEAGMDLAIRVGALRDSTLVARKLAPNRRTLCASPAYLAARGAPKHPGELVAHDCLILGEQRDWRFVTPGGPLSVRVGGRLASDNGEVLRDAVLAGLGIALKSTWDVGAHLRSGALVPVLPAYPLAEEVAIWAVYPSRAFVPPKTHALIEFLQARFGPAPYWDDGDDPSAGLPRP
ncbi:LysR family transcriptional regulator [Pandoraea cepalis]|uniref:LysR family transcriptional regulator n=1 Tax=Pandoraea cepalis TaxID=2508294 RepID=A0AAW7MI19_9BURK|nr:LysR family transcriptional regulator [Pandoraea cepalis]MDN4572413.1 LysR family transcriptional regulator [Pandoraea cepalis]MDN4577339.1 LysR family transcriptional regulator [Pandoraea cepalis]